MPTLDAKHGRTRRQGRRAATLAELRHRLADPTSLDAQSQQRLLELENRLARLQAAGGAFARVNLSEAAADAVTLAVVVA